MVEDRPVTIHDVARLAGVAVSSVSRVLSNHPDVSEAMRSKVEAAAHELRYSPDPVAQSLRSGTTRLVGLVVRDYANPFFGEMIGGIDEVLADAGYTLLVMSSGRDEGQELERIAMLRQRRVDGLLVATVTDTSAPTRKALANFGKPVVLLDRDFSKVSAGQILLDHASGVEEATRDLIQLGHTRIAMITGTTDVRPTRERIKGFEAAFKSTGLDSSLATKVAEVFSTQFAHDRATELLRLPEKQRPSAFIAGGLQATVGILEALREENIRPGEDIALVVCDDLPWLRVMRPQISVVSRDARGMGRAAGELVLKMIQGSQGESITLPTGYEPRDTSVPFRAKTKK